MLSHQKEFNLQVIKEAMETGNKAVVKEKTSFIEKIEVADFYIEQGYAIALVLRLVTIPRSNYISTKMVKWRRKR